MITFNDVLGVVSRRFDGETVVEMLENMDGLSALVSYRIGKSMRSLRQAADDFRDQNNDLIKKYGEENEDGKPFIAQDNEEAIEAYSEELSELSDSEPVDLKIYPVNLADLGEAQVKPIVFEMANFLFEMDDEV